MALRPAPQVARSPHGGSRASAAAIAPSPPETSPADLILVGAVIGAIGVRGEIRVRSFTQEAASVGAYGPLYDAGGRLLLTPKRARLVKDSVALSGPELASREAAEALKGAGLHVPRSALPASLAAEEVYVADLVGQDVVHVDGRPLGIVTDVRNFGAGDLLEIETEGTRWLMPFTAQNAPRIESRTIHIDPPFGLVPGEGA